VNAEILQRVGLALALAAAGWALFRLAALINLRAAAVQVRADRADAGSASEPGNGLFAPGRPAIVYFTTPQCVTCKAVQRPALRRLQERLGEALQVVEIDATERPDLAKAWKVMSVPTTFVIDAQGQPRQVNFGAASAEKLYEQLAQAAAARSSK
jgi:thioredoxin 1